MSEKRLLGWEPSEVHTHEYDDAGRMVRTVVTRESEWDDVERAKMQGLADYEAHICDCGLPESVADEDPDLDLHFRVCPVCAGVAKALRVQAAADREVVGKDPAPEVVRPDDGRHISLEPKSKPANAGGLNGNAIPGDDV